MKPLQALLLLSIGCSTAGAPAADTIELSRGKQALLPIVVPATAGAALKATAAEFAVMLGRMAGTEFKVEIGDGSRGIVLGRPADFPKLPFAHAFGPGPFEREDYILRSRPEGLYLLGSTDRAVSHAAWDLLYRFGFRQYFPGVTWEIVPPPADLKVAVDDAQSPSFHVRRIWYNWGLWGYNNEPYREWCVRNRMANGFTLNSGHSYENIIASNRAEFEKHPEYFAVNNGQRRTTGGDLKFCVSNPGLRKLVVDSAVRNVRANPAIDSVSMDPSDGGNWCECADCAAMGGVSNRVLTLANDVAEAINTLGFGAKYVGMYAYNKHSAPPTIRVHPNVIVSATTAFIGGGFTFDQVVEGWQRQGATIGVYDYLSVVDWDWNLPRGGGGSRPASVCGLLAKIHRMGARFYDAESGDCWGPCGLGYYAASRTLWSVAEEKRLAEITEDFLTRCFGSAREPMREYYRLITADTQRRPPSDLLGRMYRQLQGAFAATTDPAVRERLNALLLYTRHAELYMAFADGKEKVDAVARHDYRIRKTMMVHSYGLWCRLLSQKAALTDNHPLKSDAPFLPEELAKILEDGVAKNVPVDPGFTGVEFSRALVPAAPLKLPAGPPGQFPAAPQDHQQYYFWVPEGVAEIPLKVEIRKVWANRMPRVTLYSPNEVSLEPVAVDETCKPDGVPRDLVLKTTYGGLHRLVTVDGGDHTRVDFPAGWPVTIESGIDTREVTSHFRGPWTLSFYVPKGTRVVGGWASRIANWAPRISGKLLDGDGREQLDFARIEEGWFKVAVPEGQDGRLWTFQNSQGQRLLMTVPPCLARSGAELLLPREVVEADRSR